MDDLTNLRNLNKSDHNSNFSNNQHLLKIYDVKRQQDTNSLEYQTQLILEQECARVNDKIKYKSTHSIYLAEDGETGEFNATKNPMGLISFKNKDLKVDLCKNISTNTWNYYRYSDQDFSLETGVNVHKIPKQDINKLLIATYNISLEVRRDQKFKTNKPITI